MARAVAERLCDQIRPSLVTLKNQLYFAKHYHDRGKGAFDFNVTSILCKLRFTTNDKSSYFSIPRSDETVKRHRLRLHQKTGPLVAEICEANKLEGGKDTEKLYQKILAVITLLSGLGSPTVSSVLR